MPNQKNTNKSHGTFKQKTAAVKRLFFNKQMLVLVMVLIILWIPYDVLLGGNIRFYSNWIKCGERPVAIVPGKGFFAGGVPHYYKPPSLSLLRGPMEYMCSAHEAELNGLSANEKRYDYPNLSQEENVMVRKKYLLP